MLKGNLVFLRALELSDVDSLYNWENNPEYWHFGDTLIPFSREQLIEYVTGLKDIYADKQLRLVICSNTDERVLGFADFFDFDPRHSRAAIGILIAEKSERAKGYGSEALQLMCNYGFEILGMHQLYCNIATDNDASLRLFSSLGFVQCGLFKEWKNIAGNWQDVASFQKISTLP